MSSIRLHPCRRYGAGIISFLLFIYSYFSYRHGVLIAGHVLTAEQTYKGNFLILHPGIYWMNNVLATLTSLEVQQSFGLLLALHVALAFLAIVWVFKRLAPGEVSDEVLWLLALAVMLAMHIGLPLVNRTVYNFGIVNRPSFMLRNATYTGLLPYAFLSFGLLMLLCRQPADAKVAWGKRSVAAGGLLLVSALIKPSFAVSIIPAIGLYSLAEKRTLGNRLTLMAVMVPAGLLILLQFYIGFVNNPIPPYASHLVLDPWAVWEKNNSHPLLSLLTGTLFPLLVLCYCRKSLGFETKIAWLNLLLSLMPYILLRQSGGWFYDRDFEWSYLTARQLLFLCSIIEWWRWKKRALPGLPERIAAVDVAGIVLCAHVMFGYARLLLVDQVWCCF